jgi:hypothetical protein
VRTISAPVRALLASAAFNTIVKVEIADAGGVMRDYRTYGGVNWIDEYSISEEIDQPVATATVRLKLDAGTLSLSPLRGDSSINEDGAAIDVARPIAISLATVAVGATPLAADFHEVFRGKIDKVSWPDEQVEVTARDDTGQLVDQITQGTRNPVTGQVDDLSNYGNGDHGSPERLTTVLQRVLDLQVTSGFVLYAPSEPTLLVTDFPFTRESIMEVLQRGKDMIGWDLRYRWHDGTEAFRLTLIDPDRAASPVDTITPGMYVNVVELEKDRTRIRNVGELRWPLKSGANVVFRKARREDAASILKYGRRPIIIQEPSDSPIDSAEEAQAMIDAAIADLAEPYADQRVEMWTFWPVQLNDVLTFAANGKHYDAAQVLAVVGIEHVGTRERQRTFLKVRGAPVANYRRWLGRGTTGAQPRAPGSTELRDFSHVDDDVAGTRTYTWARGDDVTAVWVWNRVVATPITADPWPSVLAPPSPHAPDGAYLAVGEDEYTVTKPPQGFERYTVFQPLSLLGGRYVRGAVVKRNLLPKPQAMAVAVKAVVVGAEADLEVHVTAGPSDWPVQLAVYQDSPDGAPIALLTLTENDTITKLDDADLGAIALPDRDARHFYAKLTNVAGLLTWGHISADRDPLAEADVTVRDFAAAPAIDVDYDDDTDAVRIRTPADKLKTYSSLVGVDTVTYTVGDILDDASTESLLEVDESRGPYAVEVQGGGEWRTIWRGNLRGRPSLSPILNARAVLNADRNAADLYCIPSSLTSEKVTLRLRESDAADAPVYRLCVGAGDSTALFVTNGTEIGPSHFFVNEAGGSPSARLSGIALTRDQLKRRYLQAVNEESGVSSVWVPVPLSLMEQPWLESLHAVFDVATRELVITVVGGAHTASVYVEASQGADYASPLTDDADVADGGQHRFTFALSGSQQGRTWYLRARPFNATALGGLPGEWQAVTVDVPAVVTFNPNTEEDDEEGLVSIVVDDAGGYLAAVDPINFEIIVLGAKSLVGPTTAPGGGGSGLYTYRFALDEKHASQVNAYGNFVDLSRQLIGSWTFDSDKVANVVSLTVADNGNGTAKATVVVDTDTVVSPADGVRYRVDGGSWTETDADSGTRTAEFNITQTAAQQLIEVEGKNARGEWGPTVSAQIPPHVGYAANLTLTVTPAGDAIAVIATRAPILSWRHFSTHGTAPTPPDDADVISSGADENSSDGARIVAATGLVQGERIAFRALGYSAVSHGGAILAVVAGEADFQNVEGAKRWPVLGSDFIVPPKYNSGGGLTTNNPYAINNDFSVQPDGAAGVGFIGFKSQELPVGIVLTGAGLKGTLVDAFSGGSGDLVFAEVSKVDRTTGVRTVLGYRQLTSAGLSITESAAAGYASDTFPHTVSDSYRYSILINVGPKTGTTNRPTLQEVYWIYDQPTQAGGR